jgi:histidine triad (HIT) family protein
MQRNCVFCDIINEKSPADVMFKDDDLVVFKDIHPQAPVHLLIVPQKHIRSINDLSADDEPIISKMIMKAKETARDLKIADSGYKLVFHVERGGGQIIFHLHLHLIGGWR